MRRKSTKRKIWFFSSLSITIGTIILLVTGSPLLTLPLDEANTIPLGTFITWAGMIALPLSIFWGARELRQPTRTFTNILSGLLKVTLILAILWVPLSYFLAGNISFSFSEKASFQGGQMAMKWFWVLSYGIAIGAIATLLFYWIYRVIIKIQA